MAQQIKNPPTMQETQEMRVQSLGQEDLLEKEMATHSFILAWKIPWTRNLGGYSPMGRRVGLSTARTRLNKYVLIKSHSDRPQVLLIYRY